MKKILAIILAACSITLCISGCKAPNDNLDATKTTESKESDTKSSGNNKESKKKNEYNVNLDEHLGFMTIPVKNISETSSPVGVYELSVQQKTSSYTTGNYICGKVKYNDDKYDSITVNIGADVFDSSNKKVAHEVFEIYDFIAPGDSVDFDEHVYDLSESDETYTAVITDLQIEPEDKYKNEHEFVDAVRALDNYFQKEKYNLAQQAYEDMLTTYTQKKYEKLLNKIKAYIMDAGFDVENIGAGTTKTDLDFGLYYGID